MGICGGAIIPQLFAVLKQHHSFQLVFLVLMVPAYCYILFFALLNRRISAASFETRRVGSAARPALASGNPDIHLGKANAMDE